MGKTIIISLFVIFINSIFFQNDLTFKEGDRILKLEINNGKNHLKFGNNNIIKLKIQNINIEKLTVCGQGLKVLTKSIKNQEVTVEVNVKEAYVKNDKWNMYFIANEKDTILMHKFLIDVKK